MAAFRYISRSEIINLHQQIIGRIGGHPGIRDSAALDSCSAQPRTFVFGHERFPTVFDKAGAYCFFIVRLHPFVDGNKRTGLLAALTFLLDHGCTPSFDEDEAYDLIQAVTRNEADVSDLAEFFRRSGSG